MEKNTTMKKSIIVIALALLMVGSLFAEAKDALPASVETTVELTLQLDDKYSFGVTNKVINDAYVTALAAGAKSEIKSDDIIGTLNLTYNNATYKINERACSTSDPIYVSYLFTEYKACTLSMYINKPLTSTNNNASGKKDTINYVASFKESSDTDWTDVNSASNTAAASAVTVKEIATAATKIGEHVQGSFELKISSTDSLEGKIEDTYSSQIVLCIAAK